MAGKVIITGPGRAGTSFLVRLLTRLGEDTGFSADNDHYTPSLRAGCEVNVVVHLLDGTLTRELIEKAPRVLKSPDWSLVLKGLVQQGWIQVDHVIIPFRDLDVAAKSRLSVGLDWLIHDYGTPENKLAEQANIHGLALGRALEACWVCELPHTVLMFPRLVLDEEYCYQGLARAFTLDREEFQTQWRNLAKPKQIQTS